jgi:hypothetical protein
MFNLKSRSSSMGRFTAFSPWTAAAPLPFHRDHHNVTAPLQPTCNVGMSHSGQCNAQGSAMKQKMLPILVVLLATAVLVVGCKKTEETTATAPTAAEPAPAPAPEAPPPATEPMPPTPAPAAPVDSGMSFEDMDKNKDGGISKDELADTEMLSQHFAGADKDSDGKLSKAEVDAHRAEMAAAPGG